MDRDNMIVIDCTNIKNKQQLHQLLAKELSFPSYYGHNLDALMDCLTDIRRDTVICLRGWDALGDWKAGFGETFADASAEDPHLTFVYEP